MTEDQIEMLRHLIKQEIDAAQLEEGWKCFIDSFKFRITTT